MRFSARCMRVWMVDRLLRVLGRPGNPSPGCSHQRREQTNEQLIRTLQTMSSYSKHQHDATNMPLHPLKMQHTYVCCFLPPYAPHFDTITESVPFCNEPKSKHCGTFPANMCHFPVKKWHVCRIVACLAKSGAICFPHKYRGKP